MAAETKKVSELALTDIGRKVRFAPDEETLDVGMLESFAHYEAQSFLTIDGTQHVVTDREVGLGFLN